MQLVVVEALLEEGGVRVDQPMVDEVLRLLSLPRFREGAPLVEERQLQQRVSLLGAR